MLCMIAVHCPHVMVELQTNDKDGVGPQYVLDRAEGVLSLQPLLWRRALAWARSDGRLDVVVECHVCPRVLALFAGWGLLEAQE